MHKPSKAAHTKNIVITGATGFLGSTLLKSLENDRRFRNIIAIDKKPPPFKLKKAKWLPFDLTQADVDQKLASFFEKQKTKIIVHTALLTQPIRNLEESHEVQSVGTMHLLNAAAASKAHKLILASTTDVYGAFPENPNFLTEEHPAKGGGLSPFLKDKVEVEEQFLRFQKKHPKKIVTILRPATILGPTVNNFKTHFFQNPCIPIVMGFDPLVQFVQERDVIRAFIKAIEEDHPGIFNIVAEGVLPLTRVIHILGRVPIPVPTFLLYPAADILWYANIGAIPASHIHFLKYLCIADGTKAWHKLKFRPVYNSLEALHSFIGKDLKQNQITQRLEEIEDAKA